MKINLDELSFEALTNVTDEQIFRLLSYEWDNATDHHNQIGVPFQEKQMAKKHQEVLPILTLLHEKSIKNETMETGPLGYVNYSLLEKKLTEEEELLSRYDFTYLMKALYLTGYIEPFVVEDFSKMSNDQFNKIDIDELIEDDFTTKIFDYPIRWKYNLHWLYVNKTYLFEKLAEDHGGKEAYISKELIYRSILDNGPITFMHECYFKISNMGLHWVHSMLVQQTTSELKKSVREQKSKINNFYKEIVTIIALLLTAFSVIGLNISAIPKIESGFISKVLMINFSIILVLQVIFFLLYYFVFDSQATANVKYWIIGIVFTVIILGATAAIGFLEEQNSVEQFKEEIMREREKEKELQDQFIDRMKDEMRRLENEFENREHSN